MWGCLEAEPPSKDTFLVSGNIYLVFGEDDDRDSRLTIFLPHQGGSFTPLFAPFRIELFYLDPIPLEESSGLSTIWAPGSHQHDDFSLRACLPHVLGIRALGTDEEGSEEECNQAETCKCELFHVISFLIVKLWDSHIHSTIERPIIQYDDYPLQFPKSYDKI